MNETDSPIKRFFKLIFRWINITRKIIINFVFFIVLMLFFAALSSDKSLIEVPSNAALVLNITGDLVEQKYEIDPVDAFIDEAFEQSQQRPEVLVSDVTRVISAAKTDDRIQLLVLKLEGMQSAGLTKIRTIAKSIEDFKTSGKKVIAYGNQYQQDAYYLASFADEIWLNPNGWLILDGYGSYQLYYKSALEKLAVSSHIFRVGTYKSAVEPYIRDDMSLEAKQANQEWLDDLWLQYKEDVAQQRGFNIDNFDETTEALLAKLQLANGKVAQYALNNQWVDQLKTREQISSSLIDLVGKSSKSDNYRQINFKDYLATLVSPLPSSSYSSAKIALIVAKGIILDGKQKPGSIGGDSTAELLRRARNNPQVKAVVLRVDSPGGSAYASEIIRQEVELLKAAGKPVVASMGTYAASGGYWISAPADKIIAAPTTITGSIGIYGFLMTFEDSLSKLGIYTDGVGTTDLSGFGLTRPLNDGNAKLIQLNIERGYQDFINLVAVNRGMTKEQVDAIAQGRVWSGIKAQAIGLVDELGELEDAVISAASLANITDYQLITIEKKQSPTDLFMENLLGNLAIILPERATIKPGPMEQLFLKIHNDYSLLNTLNDPQGSYTLCLACQLP